MKRAMKLAAAAAVALALAAASGVSWYAFSAPLTEDLPLASDLVSATTAAGGQLLAESAHKTDHGQLAPFLISQRRRAFCGPATSAAVINAALRPSKPVTQFSLFGTAGPNAKSELSVSFSGLTLEELAALLRANGLQVQTVHAEHSGIDAFRAAAQSALSEPHTFLVVNYDRRILEQSGAGHISPVGAYHPATDRLLVMDVATYKYPYTWVPVQKLWNAMNTVDRDAGRSRGYLLVKASDVTSRRGRWPAARCLRWLRIPRRHSVAARFAIRRGARRSLPSSN